MDWALIIYIPFICHFSLLLCHPTYQDEQAGAAEQEEDRKDLVDTLADFIRDNGPAAGIEALAEAQRRVAAEDSSHNRRDPDLCNPNNVTRKRSRPYFAMH